MKKETALLAIASAILFSACGGSTPPPVPAPEMSAPPAAPAAAPAPAPEPAKDTAAMMHDTTTAAPAAATVYTCPMHPEVKMNAPGKCPKCGMTLVAMAAPAAAPAATAPAAPAAAPKGAKASCSCATNKPDCKCGHCSTGGANECPCGTRYHAH